MILVKGTANDERNGISTIPYLAEDEKKFTGWFIKLDLLEKKMHMRIRALSAGDMLDVPMHLFLKGFPSSEPLCNSSASVFSLAKLIIMNLSYC